jgi:hypothetical protein
VKKRKIFTHTLYGKEKWGGTQGKGRKAGIAEFFPSRVPARG